MLCIEPNDEWFVGRSYLSAGSIATVLEGPQQHSEDEPAEKRRPLSERTKGGRELEPA
jgi:hypothetical protein